jgi:hypothetical protein
MLPGCEELFHRMCAYGVVCGGKKPSCTDFGCDPKGDKVHNDACGVIDVVESVTVVYVEKLLKGRGIHEVEVGEGASKKILDIVFVSKSQDTNDRVEICWRWRRHEETTGG